MFWRKTRNKESPSQYRQIDVCLAEQVLFSGDLTELPLKEEWILKKSIEFFNDPAPCYIHRGAVTIRLLNEIWESAETGSGTASEYADYPEGAIIKAK